MLPPPALTFSDLKPVLPIADGLARLKEDIAAQDKVFCICTVACEYHVSSNDAKETFRRAVDRGFLKPADRTQSFVAALQSDQPLTNHLFEDAVFVPTKPADPRAIEEQMRRAHDSVDHAYEILERIDPNYRRGVRLLEQGAELHDKLIDAFLRLKTLGALPITTGNGAFNHQGMTLLMASCFDDEDKLVNLVRAPKDDLPKLLPVSSDFEERIEKLYEELGCSELEPRAREDLRRELDGQQAALAALIDEQFRFQERVIQDQFDPLTADTRPN